MRAAIAIASFLFLVSGTGLSAAEWHDGVPMGNARAFSAGVVNGEDVYVAGGAGISAPQSSVEIYDMIGDFWRSGPALPEGVQQAAMASLDGVIYVTGGYLKDSDGADNARLWVLDPKRGFWIEGPAMPGPRAWHGMVAAHGKLYVMGGLGGDSRAVYAFDPEDEEWRTLPARLPESRAGLAVAVQGSRIYAIGGERPDGQISGRVDILDLEKARWEDGPRLPSPRAGHAAAVSGTAIHVAGGENNSPPSTYDSHFILDTARGVWREAEPMPSPRHGLVLVKGRRGVVAIGGAAGPGFYTVFTETDAVSRFQP